MKINGMDYNWNTYHYYADPGHGWLKVPYDAIYRLGLARLVSGYSYERGNFIYLEEDADVSMFISALKGHGLKYRVVSHFGNKMSKIRNYRTYNHMGVYDHDERYLNLEKSAKDILETSEGKEV